MIQSYKHTLAKLDELVQSTDNKRFLVNAAVVLYSGRYRPRFRTRPYFALPTCCNGGVALEKRSSCAQSIMMRTGQDSGQPLLALSAARIRAGTH